MWLFYHHCDSFFAMLSKVSNFNLNLRGSPHRALEDSEFDYQVVLSRSLECIMGGDNDQRAGK